MEAMAKSIVALDLPVTSGQPYKQETLGLWHFLAYLQDIQCPLADALRSPLGLTVDGCARSISFKNLETVDFGVHSVKISPNAEGAVSFGTRFHKVFSAEDLNNIPWWTYENIFRANRLQHDQGHSILNWGGDHSVGMSTLAAFLSCYPNGKILWVDAHADANLPETSVTGHLHGMPVGLLASDRWSRPQWLNHIYLQPAQIAYVGIRDLDPYEKEWIRQSNILCFTPQDIRDQGVSAIVESLVDWANGCPIHISWDIDVIDPYWAPATAVPVIDGLMPHEAFYLAHQLGRQLDIRSVDLVEVYGDSELSEATRVTYQIAARILRELFVVSGEVSAQDLAYSRELGLYI